jgi:TIR domain
MENLPPAKIFIAFSHKDKTYKEELKRHFATILKNKKATIWDDSQIGAGEFWNETIEQHLHDSDIILLLLSSDALFSENFEKEVNLALELHRAEKLVAIPILLRACDWRDFADFSRIEVLPEKALEVDDWPKKDQAYLNIVQGVKKVISSIEAEKARKLDENAENSQNIESKADEIARKKAERHEKIKLQKALESANFKLKVIKESRRIFK